MKVDLSHPVKTPINFSIGKIQNPKFLFDNKRHVIAHRDNFIKVHQILENIAPR